MLRDILPDAQESDSPLPDRSGGFRNVFAVPLPDWISAELIVVLACAGVAAFAVTGFLGYPDSPGGLMAFPFNKPSALFAYGCALHVTLLIMVLRHPSPRQEMAGDPERVMMARRGQLIGALLVTLAAIIVVVLAYLQPAFVTTLLKQIATWLQLAETGKLLANLVNWWCVGVYALDSAARWAASLGHLAGSWPSVALRQKRLANTLGLLGNDLVAGSVLTGLLALCFRADVLSYGAQALQVGARFGDGGGISDCTVSLYLGNCHGLRMDPSTLPTITFVDAIGAGCLLAAGLLFIALYLLVRALQAKRPLGDVLLEILAQLRHINRVLALGIEALVAPLRRVAWPALMFASISCVALAARATQQYLHLVSCEHQWVIYGQTLEPVAGCKPATIPFDISLLAYADLAQALLYTALAGSAVVLAAMVQLYDRKNPDRSERQVAGYWLPALVRIGATVLIPFGLLSLALGVINFVLVQTHPQGPIPMSFYPPGTITYLAGVAVLIVIGRRLMRGRGGGRNALSQ